MKTKKMRILVMNPPFEIDRGFIDYPYFANMGALQTASYLSSKGYDVQIADSFSQPQSGARQIQEDRFITGCPPEEFLSLVEPMEFDCAVFCLSVFHRPHEKNKFTANVIRGFRRMFPSVPIAAADAYSGGMHYIDYDSGKFLSNYPEVDTVARGESELGLARWTDCISSGKKAPRRIGGGEGVALDSLPFPAWEMINVENNFRFIARFFAALRRPDGFSAWAPYLPVATSRGCIYECSFCSGNIESIRTKYRRHSNEYVKNYISHLKTKYSIRGIAVLDGIANANAKRFTELLGIFDESGLKVNFANGLRADLLTREHIKTIKRISPSLAVSAETACDRVMADLRKGLDIKAVENVAAWCRDKKLPLGIHYMAGSPGESAGDVNETFAHALGMSARYGAAPLMQYFVPLPGTLHGNSVPTKLFSKDYFKYFHTVPAGAKGALPSETLRQMVSLFKQRLAGINPEKLIVNLTYRCNNRCAMCATGGRPKRDIPFETVKKLLEEYAAKGVRMLDIDGGEPTMHGDLFDVIGTAAALGYDRISVTTNGRKLASRDFASMFLLSGITDVQISLYGGEPAVHEAATGMKGSFEQTAAGIRHVARLKPDRIGFGVNTVLTNSNCNHLYELAEFVSGLGVGKLAIQFPTPFGRALPEHCPDMAAARREIKKCLADFGGGLKINIINLPPCALPGMETLAAEDAQKFGRVMAFVDTPPLNLGGYLASKRKRIDKCASCVYFIACEGIYDWD